MFESGGSAGIRGVWIFESGMTDAIATVLWKGPRSGGRSRLQGGDGSRPIEKETAGGARSFEAESLRIRDFYAGYAEDFAFVGLLDEGDDTKVFGIGVGLQFHSYILRKGLSFVELADFSQFFDHGYVLQLLA